MSEVRWDGDHKLKCNSLDVLQVDYEDMERFIRETTGQRYDSISDNEWGNYQHHLFRVNRDTPFDAYWREKWDAFKAGKCGDHDTFMMPTILRGLCLDGHLPPGNYLISVFW